MHQLFATPTGTGMGAPSKRSGHSPKGAHTAHLQLPESGKSTLKVKALEYHVS